MDLTTVQIVNVVSPRKITILYTNFPATRLQELEVEMTGSWEELPAFCKGTEIMPRRTMVIRSCNF